MPGTVGNGFLDKTMYPVAVSELAESISTSLLHQVQRHDQQAWHRLVNLYAPLVYSWCRRWGVPTDDAPDVVQDVFRAVAGGIARFERYKPQHTFRGWLWTIARHAAIRYAARHSNRPRGQGGTDHLLRLQQIPEHEEDDSLLAEESAQLLHSALDAIRGDFQPRTWEIFWRSAVLGQETATIASDYVMKPKAVRQAKHRVLTRLREECNLIFGSCLSDHHRVS